VEITEVRIKLMDDPSERLQAFCSITFDDCFVVRDLKIIGGASGPFVAMPSRKLTGHCPQCGCKNHLRAAYCNQCGGRLREDRLTRDEDGRAKLYADIAHPINSACREMIQQRVIAALQLEIERSKLPGYVSTYDDIDQDGASEACDKVDGRGSGRKEGGRKAPIRTSTGDTAQVQPAERPHGPHRAAPRAPAELAGEVQPPTSETPPRAEIAPVTAGASPGDFGAGIF
jgi:stage V sporulation protein G